jgi:hypothetical protein
MAARCRSLIWTFNQGKSVTVITRFEGLTQASRLRLRNIGVNIKPRTLHPGDNLVFHRSQQRNGSRNGGVRFISNSSFPGRLSRTAEEEYRRR